MERSLPKLSLVERIASSSAGSRFFALTSKLDPWLLEWSDGRLSTLPGQPILLLRHTGARSGRIRKTALVYATDGDDIILVASNGGSPRHPAWYHNLRADPLCRVVARGRSGRHRATLLEGDDREAAWARALEVYGGYAVYQERAGDRQIPLFRLTPETDS